MVQISNEEFEKLIHRAVAALPSRYVDNLKNVAFLLEDEPSIQQRQLLMLRDDQTLFGLYEGVPLSQRQGTTKVLPDKITIFKGPIERSSPDIASLYNRVGRTIWHEVAHYYGLDHKRINDLEAKEREGLG
ncbi:MAG TPA: metallopeptidase family protein [Candidatus Saccharimonadales bacterium]|jgi:predicted Zn-dependent protease with MMP-like domain|nr:metallopeptidase family protein [Candidatus Saccharimonadales bacterium]